MNIFKAIHEEVLVPIHPAGWPFIGLFAVVTVALGFVWPPSTWIGVPLSLWCVYFFRNPPRIHPDDPDLLISPADGRVLGTGIAELPEELSDLQGEYRCISIFMNVFDVHVNRSPAAGTITKKTYIPGKFVNASLDKASSDNERLALCLELANKKVNVGVVQIAGLVARRILCDREEGDKLATGQVFGLIRFGSRVDVWVPAEYEPLVYAGQRTLAGETVLCDLKKAQSRRRSAKSARTRK